MISNEKCLNYEVVDIDEIFNFHIKVISIQIKIKKIQFFKNEQTPTTVRNGGRDSSYRGSHCRSKRRQWYNFTNYQEGSRRMYIFVICKK
jgi:hypothetical protein